MRTKWIGWLALPALLAACAAPDPSPTPTQVPTPTSTPVPPTATPIPPTSTPAPPTATPSADWDLVWVDEFDAPDGASPDPERWSFNTGGGGWGNGERQYYTDRPENAVIDDGVLYICARDDEQEPYRGYRYTSARLVTKRKGDWTYGRFEVRARLPEGQGIWPAIWMLPSHMAYGGWPMGGEIDIMEMLGQNPIRVYGTLHYGNPHTHTGHYYVLRTGETFADDFHVFALEWEPGEIRWYVDGYHYQTQTEWFTSKLDTEYPAPFDRPFHLLLNVAVGGQWPGNPDETTEFPQCMAIDYVRVYQSPELAE
ncbi:MAG: glycoside hydrolase family 16 protein [Anaerolineae bacterium]|nr:glycoside hydrolase family 16 protein [Anaerolineae bacterium]